MLLFHAKLVRMAECNSIPDWTKNFVKNTDYRITAFSAGERILELLPPNSRKTCVPCSHCTIYVCRLPKECTEEHLYNLFSDYGQIQEIKLTIGKEGYTRGYAFIRYQHAKNACIAIKRCNGQNLYNVDDSKHFRIGISHSPGPQLLITGIPMDLTEASVEQTLEECLTGLESVLLPKNINDDSLNRGYAFATFDSYENASKARRKIWYYKTALWSSLCMVEWALPEMPSLSDDVRNLKIQTHIETILIK